MKFNFLIIDLPLDDKGFRQSFSFLEFWIEDMKYPTALFHYEFKNKKFYWELLYSNLWFPGLRVCKKESSDSFNWIPNCYAITTVNTTGILKGKHFNWLFWKIYFGK